MSQAMRRAVQIVKIREQAQSGEARAVRKHAGLSLAEVGSDIGVHASTVQKWELGQRSPRGENAIRYASLLGRLSAMSAK